jgi:hypothetical protein
MFSESFKIKGVRVLERVIDNIVSKINMYRRIDDSFKRDLSFNIPNFSIPFIINTEHIQDLVDVKKEAGDHISMYL